MSDMVVEMGTTPLTSNDQFSVTLKEFYHVKGGERKWASSHANLSVTLHTPDHGLGASFVPFAPYDYIIVYNVYKVNNTDCTFCKIRNDYYIVYNTKYGLGERYDKADC